MIRNIESWVSGGWNNRMVTCLPGAKSAGITMSQVDRLPVSVEGGSAVAVHVGTNKMGLCSPRILEEKIKIKVSEQAAGFPHSSLSPTHVLFF